MKPTNFPNRVKAKRQVALSNRKSNLTAIENCLKSVKKDSELFGWMTRKLNITLSEIETLEKKIK